MMGKSNPDLVRSMQGLACGLGFSGELCGALIGGAALLGLYAGKGSTEQEEDPRLFFMLEDLVAWFKLEIGSQYRGIRCDEILTAGRADQTVHHVRFWCLASHRKSKNSWLKTDSIFPGWINV